MLFSFFFICLGYVQISKFQNTSTFCASPFWTQEEALRIAHGADENQAFVFDKKQMYISQEGDRPPVLVDMSQNKDAFFTKKDTRNDQLTEELISVLKAVQESQTQTIVQEIFGENSFDENQWNRQILSPGCVTDVGQRITGLFVSQKSDQYFDAQGSQKKKGKVTTRVSEEELVHCFQLANYLSRNIQGQGIHCTHSGDIICRTEKFGRSTLVQYVHISIDPKEQKNGGDDEDDTVDPLVLEVVGWKKQNKPCPLKNFSQPVLLLLDVSKKAIYTVFIDLSPARIGNFTKGSLCAIQPNSKRDGFEVFATQQPYGVEDVTTGFVTQSCAEKYDRIANIGRAAFKKHEQDFRDSSFASDQVEVHFSASVEPASSSSLTIRPEKSSMMPFALWIPSGSASKKEYITFCVENLVPDPAKCDCFKYGDTVTHMRYEQLLEGSRGAASDATPIHLPFPCATGPMHCIESTSPALCLTKQSNEATRMHFRDRKRNATNIVLVSSGTTVDTRYQLEYTIFVLLPHSPTKTESSNSSSPEEDDRRYVQDLDVGGFGTMVGPHSLALALHPTKRFLFVYGYPFPWLFRDRVPAYGEDVTAIFSRESMAAFTNFLRQLPATIPRFRPVELQNPKFLWTSKREQEEKEEEDHTYVDCPTLKKILVELLQKNFPSCIDDNFIRSLSHVMFALQGGLQNNVLASFRSEIMHCLLREEEKLLTPLRQQVQKLQRDVQNFDIKKFNQAVEEWKRCKKELKKQSSRVVEVLLARSRKNATSCKNLRTEVKKRAVQDNVRDAMNMTPADVTRLLEDDCETTCIINLGKDESFETVFGSIQDKSQKPSVEVKANPRLLELCSDTYDLLLKASNKAGAGALVNRMLPKDPNSTTIFSSAGPDQLDRTIMAIPVVANDIPDDFTKVNWNDLACQAKLVGNLWRIMFVRSLVNSKMNERYNIIPASDGPRMLYACILLLHMNSLIELRGNLVPPPSRKDVPVHEWRDMVRTLMYHTMLAFASGSQIPLMPIYQHVSNHSSKNLPLLKPEYFWVHKLFLNAFPYTAEPMEPLLANTKNAIVLCMKTLVKCATDPMVKAQEKQADDARSAQLDIRKAQIRFLELFIHTHAKYSAQIPDDIHKRLLAAAPALQENELTRKGRRSYNRIKKSLENKTLSNLNDLLKNIVIKYSRHMKALKIVSQKDLSQERLQNMKKKDIDLYKKKQDNAKMELQNSMREIHTDLGSCILKDEHVFVLDKEPVFKDRNTMHKLLASIWNENQDLPPRDGKRQQNFSAKKDPSPRDEVLDAIDNRFGNKDALKLFEKSKYITLTECCQTRGFPIPEDYYRFLLEYVGVRPQYHDSVARKLIRVLLKNWSNFGDSAKKEALEIFEQLDKLDCEDVQLAVVVEDEVDEIPVEEKRDDENDVDGCPPAYPSFLEQDAVNIPQDGAAEENAHNPPSQTTRSVVALPLRLATLENEVFLRIKGDLPMRTRIEQLEVEIYGTIQGGVSLRRRIEELELNIIGN